ncbi:TonB-dependent receptor [Colwellia sp. 1_MG-2023]|uniref:TonB-dependent receptor n=1 Tax=Colwellia sp. 1_MG-2023 TaxID=3062649 RepID=UPI0026E117C0|nr:TonB-dependent receptor [Colwellia sp. 1_MG-2023]MDO6446506.1 TonB-dependent receptor [Colwellia sp. 1_MG-2023]
MIKVFFILYYIILIACSYPFLVNGQDIDSLEIIEVTAQKRTQSVQDVPISIAAISYQSLSSAKINQAMEVTTLVPNVNATRSISGLSNYYIRGVGMDGFNLSSIPAVGLYVDDVAIQSPALANFALFDLNKVEVLKGPQNTLFGKNTTGGALNFFTNEANNEDEITGFAEISIGNYHLIKTEGALSFPLSDKASVRLSGYSHQRDGTVTSNITNNPTEYNDVNRFGARLKLLYSFDEDRQLSISLYGGQQAQIAEVKTAMSPVNDELLININDQDLTSNHSSMINPPNDVEAFGGYLKFTTTHNNFIFNAISSFENVLSKRMDDWGGQHLASSVYQSAIYNSTNTEAISQEFQWQSKSESNIHWIIGLLYNLEYGDIFQAALIDPGGPGRPDDSIDDAGIGPMFDRGAWLDHKSQTLSAYGQFTYPITPKLNITTGYRWTTQKLQPTVHSAGMMMDLPGQEYPLGSLGWYSLGNNDFDRFSDFMGFKRAERFINANGGFPASEKIDEKFNEWGGKISLDYHLHKNMMLYGAVSRGFKMGAVNSNPTVTAYNSLLNKTVKPESLVTTELGFKTDLYDNTLRFNGAIFKNTWRDYQFFLVYNPGNPANLFASLVNLPTAESTGAEIELNWKASASLRFNIGMGWLNSKVTDGQLNTSGISPLIVDGFQNQVVTGNELTNAPKFSYSISALKTVEFNDSDLELSLHYTFLDKHTHQLAGTHNNIWRENFSEGMLGLLTLNSSFYFGLNREYLVSLWVKNTTNEKYCTERAIAPGTSPDTARLCAQGDPRSVGLTFKRTF